MAKVKIKDKALIEYVVIAVILALSVGLLFFLLRDSFDVIFSITPVSTDKTTKL